LPWRDDPRPWKVWVSEVMLQQTQVGTVRDYFSRFTARFPDVAALAKADLPEVLRLWEGLGYYRRARSLHQAARKIVDEQGGQLPDTAAGWQALPGVGRYTAHAILSIASNQSLPILEGNTIRLYSRLLGSLRDVALPATQKLLWEFAGAIVPQKHAGTFNQALMDLGSLVCRVKEPDCGRCPVAEFCHARRLGRQARIPVKSRSALPEAVREAALLVQRRGRFLMVQRGPGEWWEGLWDFPRVRLSGAQSRNSEQHPAVLEKWLFENTGLKGTVTDAVFEIRHVVTRYNIRLASFEVRDPVGKLARGSGHCWRTAGQIADLPLSVTGRKLFRRLVLATRVATG
jgi:A/G-specific adenine glycosylase